MPSLTVLAASSIAALLCAGLTAAEPGTIEVRLGKTISRSLDDVRAAGFAYGPKQDVEGSGETCVYLPYGARFLNYRGVVKGQLTDAGPDSMPEFVSSSGGQTAGQLTYRLDFDRPIKAFRFAIGYAETVLEPTCSAGVEYSTDEKAWTLAKEIRGESKVVAPFPAAVTAVDGLDTRTLYLRVFARNSSNPAANSGMYLKVRLAGNPAWGDSTTTFFTGQARVWLTTK
jgi:hypothetical protein